MATQSDANDLPPDSEGGGATHDRSSEPTAAGRGSLKPRVTWPLQALQVALLVAVCFVLFVGAREVWRRPLPALAGSPMVLYDRPQPPPPPPPPPPPVPPAPPAPALPAFVVYFENGSDRLSPSLKAELQRFGAALKACGNPRIRIVGWVSEAEFKRDNEMQNLRLAKQRGEVVAKTLDPHLARSQMDIHVWPTLSQVYELRRFDTGTALDMRAPIAALLNRRVDILLESAACIRSSR